MQWRVPTIHKQQWMVGTYSGAGLTWNVCCTGTLDIINSTHAFWQWHRNQVLFAPCG